MTEAPPPDAIQGYVLGFLTEEWVWEEAAGAATLPQAIAVARAALETVVREEKPEIACVTLLLDGRKLGVWDLVGGQFVWTAAP